MVCSEHLPNTNKITIFLNLAVCPEIVLKPELPFIKIVRHGFKLLVA